MFRDCAAEVEVVKIQINYQLVEAHVKCQLG